MTNRIFVSRQGLTRCPSCLTHMRLDTTKALPNCPSCGRSLETTSQSSKGVLGVRATRQLGATSGALAALLGISMTTACSLTDLETDPPVREVGASSNTNEGEPNIESVPADEPIAVDIYGGPGMMGGRDPGIETRSKIIPETKIETDSQIDNLPGTLEIELPHSLKRGDYTRIVNEKGRTVGRNVLVERAVENRLWLRVTNAERRRIQAATTLELRPPPAPTEAPMAPVYGGPPRRAEPNDP